MSPLNFARAITSVTLSGLVLVGLLVVLLQGPAAVVPALDAFLTGVVGGPTAIGATVGKLTPILFIAVAATVAFRAGLFDVGQIGQYVFGAAAAGIVAPACPGPGLLVIVVTMAAGVAAGAAWSVVTHALTRLTGLDLIVLSLVANYLADGLARLLVRTTFQDPDAFSVIATRQVPEHAWLPLVLQRTSFHVGIFVALAAFIVVAVVYRRHQWGHRTRMFGLNPVAAELNGVSPTVFERQVLSVSGGICGLAGAVQVLGVFHRYQDGAFGGSASIAWSGLTAAILVTSGVVAVLPMATMLAVLSTGFVGIQRDLGVSAGLGSLLQGVVIIAAAVALRARSEPTRPRRRPQETSRD
ncbi:ABC transporter permease [Nocardioides humi]|uniref:Simple sugar transport system permease protein n=1 Tax=Nocardioides humi TaxID=449461 RepID=A0ABN2BDF2_9ACTN|nr:ABC transporter permease [Nocardioides humi]